jgi:hypothetical protein
MAAAIDAVLGEDRIAWMRTLPRAQVLESIALVHASPRSPWHSPGAEASDEELEAIYGPLHRPTVVYGHIHRSFVRTIRRSQMQEMLIVNTGSVSLSYDGDARAAYLMMDDSKPTIRRVEYDLERELKTLSESGLPHSDWVAKMLRSKSPQLPVNDLP